MRVRKGAWHYRVWKFTHFLRDDKNIPDHTNLCRYVSRTIFLPIPVGLGWVGLIAFCIFVFVVCNAWTILSGTGVFGGLMGNKDTKGEIEMMWYFPKVSVGARQVSMSAIVMSSYALLAVAVIVYMFPWTTLKYAGFGAVGIGVLALVCIIGAIIMDGFRKVGRWEGWKLFKLYIKAKKEGVCPLVTFDEPDHPAPAEVGEPQTT